MIVYDDENVTMTLLASTSLYYSGKVALSMSRDAEVIEKLSGASKVLWLTHFSRCVQFQANQDVVIFNPTGDDINLFGFLDPSKVSVIDSNKVLDEIGVSIMWLIAVDSILSQYSDYERLTISSMSDTVKYDDIMLLLYGLFGDNAITLDGIVEKRQIIGLLSEYGNPIANMLRWAANEPEKLRELLYKQSSVSKYVDSV